MFECVDFMIPNTYVAPRQGNRRRFPNRRPWQILCSEGTLRYFCVSTPGMGVVVAGGGYS